MDVSTDAGVARNGASGDSVRYLNVSDVERSVKKRVSLLRKGESPSALNLGDVPPATAEQLLIVLFEQWCEDKHSRAHPRRPASSAAAICTGMAAIAFLRLGRALPPAARSEELTKMQREEIATFGRVAHARRG